MTTSIDIEEAAEGLYDYLDTTYEGPEWLKTIQIDGQQLTIVVYTGSAVPDRSELPSYWMGFVVTDALHFEAVGVVTRRTR